ncbi:MULTISPECIES: element excision factor XisH family protein [Roseofilum]|uniref:Element excision factor XisH family protein n=2 Tax=Roseofilum TaxID=1233426 RepID=A0ABT7B468_9CYAN|nr:MULTISPECIES: element excision factor XisH family protein [Roseofilum]MDJ1168643.1 element excision factor XisH family protein [Roseofilum acuticapitatum BLCC-M154]MDJ1173930.1 element excision factor XisH family protein [Roseofilum capinflatum BLCC-M114]
MPAKDIYHNAVKNALIKDGWTITDDPYILNIGRRDLFVDIGAEKLLSAEKGEKKIAVEIKSFIGKSRVNDLENALGQYTLYSDIMRDIDPNRILYLAITKDVFDTLFQEAIGEILLRNQRFNLLIFEKKQEVIERWIP